MKTNKYKETGNTHMGDKAWLVSGMTLLIVSVLFSISMFDPQITGAATSGAGLVGVIVLGECTIPLYEGWNYISFCANITNTSVASALNQIDGDYRFVMEWNATGQEFAIYSPLSSNPPFTNFNLSKSYFIYYSATSGSVDYSSGSDFGDINFTLSQGWTTPTYPYRFTANVTKYLDTIGTPLRFMMKWNYTEQNFLIYSPLAASPEFNTISKGEGQFIYVTSQSTMGYNKTDLES